MEISVRSTNHDLALQDNKLFWRIGMRKTIFFIVLYFVIGLLLISIGYFEKPEEKPAGFTFTFGIVFILLGLIYFLQVVSAKRKFLLTVRNHIQKAKKAGIPSEILIDENKVITQNFECRQELKWSAFTSFMLYRDQLLLMRETTILTSVIVGINELPKEQAGELIDFVRRRLPEKRVSIF